VQALVTRRIVLVPFDHLSFDHGAMREANPARDIVALVESSRMTTGRPWHP
jgi:deoxyribodipyrimidine photolyase-related protein